MQMRGGVFVKVCNCPHAAVGASEQAIRGAGACAEWTSAEMGVVVGMCDHRRTGRMPAPKPIREF
jgi:hypothetical protein